MLNRTICLMLKATLTSSLTTLFSSWEARNRSEEQTVGHNKLRDSGTS